MGRFTVLMGVALPYLKYSNGGRMHVVLNREQLQEVDCFKYLG